MWQQLTYQDVGCYQTREMRIIANSVLRKKDCTTNINNAKRMLDDYRRYKTDHLSYQRQLAALDNGDKAIGLLCYHCRELIKIGSKYVKKHEGRGGGPYHLLCAKKLYVI